MNPGLIRPLLLQILAQQQLEKQETPKSQTQSQTQRPSVSIPQPHALLQAPPPQVLVIERIYSGKSNGLKVLYTR